MYVCVYMCLCIGLHTSDWYIHMCQLITLKYCYTIGNLLSGLMDSLTGATNSAPPQPKPPLDASQEELD